MNLWPLCGSVKAVPEASRSSPARQRSLRENNLGLVSRLIADSAAPLSRARLAARTGLTKATVSTLVDTLVAGGLVRELPPTPPAGAGRPAFGLVTSEATVAGLGLELNVDYTAACVVDLTGAVRYRQVAAADQRGVAPA